MLKIVKCKQINKFNVVIVVHMIISTLFSFGFFKAIRTNVGFETIAYRNADIIPTLSQDNFIRNVCKAYSYIIAFILIYLFWKTVEYITSKLGKYKKCIAIYISVMGIGILILLLIYPYFLTENATNDFTYNYVYAKEFMPMHWHGFFTNVVMCALMIFFPHPIILSVFPFFCLISILFYIFINAVKKPEFNYICLYAILAGIFFLPEVIPVASTPGRNANYAIVSLLYYTVLFFDYINATKITFKKFILLTSLVAILSTWRTEGIIYILFYPLITMTVYKVHFKVLTVGKILLSCCIFLLAFLVLKLPQDYGMKKYYDKDYFIINTPMPLSAVYMNENANFTYEGASEDLSNIDKVYPVKYLKEWGGAASIRNNMEHGRVSRQCGTGFDGTKYVISAYRILLHNPVIFLKKQINNYLQANKFYRYFYLPIPENNNLDAGLSKEALEFSKAVLEYYKIGRNDIENNYPLLSKFEFGRIIKAILSKVYKMVHYLSMHFMKYNKVAITILIFAILTHSLVKREWVWVITAGNILSIFFAILIFAPDPHAEYYYATYLCQYLYLFLYIKEHFEIRRIK